MLRFPEKNFFVFDIRVMFYTNEIQIFLFFKKQSEPQPKNDFQFKNKYTVMVFL